VKNPTEVVADLITDGCNMGVKTLYRYLHQYQAADEKAKQLVKETIKAEETLIQRQREYCKRNALFFFYFWFFFSLFCHLL